MARGSVGEGPVARALLIGAAVLIVAVLLVLPLAVLLVGAFADGVGAFAAAIADPDALAAIRLTLLIAALVVPANALFGLAAAWCLTRFRFPGRRLLASAIALPFSVSPVVTGLAYILLFGARGWFGPLLSGLGLRVVFALPGMVLVTGFVTMPFVAGQLLPLMEGQGTGEEEAALLLGANGRQMFLRVTLPKVRWGLLYGTLLCSARAMGEFGAVAVVSGRVRGLTETMPLHIEALYQDYDITAGFAVATLLAGVGLLTIAARAVLEWWGERQRRQGTQAALMPVLR